MAHHIKARPTIYKGIQMRSRLEAKFAKSLDDNPTVLKWEYEPDCYADETGEYLTDFVAWDSSERVAVKFFLEVKPHVADPVEALRRMHIIRSTEPEANLSVMVGRPSGDGFELGAACSLRSPCDFCKPAPTQIQWTQEQAQEMYRTIVKLKKQRKADLDELSALYGWIEGLLSEVKCAIGQPTWLTEFYSEMPFPRVGDE